MDFAFRLFSFLEALIPAAVILLPIMFYYLYRRNLLRTKKEILLKGIIFSLAGVVITVATFVFYSYLRGVYATRANGSTFNMDDLVPITLVVTLVLVVAAIVLGVGDEQDGVTADDPGAIHSRNLHLAGAPQKVPAWHVPWGRLHRR